MWTEARTAELRKLWGEGLSASQIAKQLGGTTRSAVIGKVHRLGLAYRASPGRRANRPTTRTRTHLAARRWIDKPLFQPVVEPSSEEERRIKAMKPIDPALGVLGLSALTCRYPVGDPKADDFAFCGRTSSGRYCTAHEKLCYPPRAQKKLARRIERLASWVASSGWRVGSTLPAPGWLSG